MASTISGRSLFRRFKSSVSLRWPSASIGTFSAVAIYKPFSKRCPGVAAKPASGGTIVGGSSLGGGIIGLERRDFKRVPSHRLDRPCRRETGGCCREIRHL